MIVPLFASLEAYLTRRTDVDVTVNRVFVQIHMMAKDLVALGTWQENSQICVAWLYRSKLFSWRGIYLAVRQKRIPYIDYCWSENSRNCTCTC